MVRTFCPLNSTMESSIDRELEVRNYNSYLEFYKKSKDDFIKSCQAPDGKNIGSEDLF